MPPSTDDLEELRLLRKWEVAIGYRIFAGLRWGLLGDGHISARDPILTDHFWVLGYGIPFRDATVDNLTLVGPDGRGVDGAAINTAGYCIHWPILDTRPELVSAAHTHTGFGTPWSANVEPFRAISQESCAFVFDQSLYEGEDLEVLTTDGGYRIARAMGTTKLCILRNHGLLTGGGSPAEAVGWFVMAEQVAEVHVKATAAEADRRRSGEGGRVDARRSPRWVGDCSNGRPGGSCPTRPSCSEIVRTRGSDAYESILELIPDDFSNPADSLEEIRAKFDLVHGQPVGDGVRVEETGEWALGPARRTTRRPGRVVRPQRRVRDLDGGDVRVLGGDRRPGVQPRGVRRRVLARPRSTLPDTARRAGRRPRGAPRRRPRP